MESLLEKLTDCDVSDHKNNPNAEHPRYSQYKNKSTKCSQEDRRRSILDARKEARYDLFSYLRNIEENIISDDDEEEVLTDDEIKAIYKRPRQYKNFVMLSEWLVDVPETFEKTYLAVPCPVGRRCLCVCYRGRTNIYHRSGNRLMFIQSSLPGGSFHTAKQGFTVLDCIWCEKNKTFYIIDLVYWSKCGYIDCDTMFRFTWLKSRIEELDVDLTSKQVTEEKKEYRFVPLPFFDCTKTSLKNLFHDPILNEFDLDGILFYHIESHYTHGPSPLVCWLKPFMLKEILGVEVLEKYMKEKPANYKNISAHIIEYNEERNEIVKKRISDHKNKKNRDKAMEQEEQEVSQGRE